MNAQAEQCMAADMYLAYKGTGIGLDFIEAQLRADGRWSVRRFKPAPRQIPDGTNYDRLRRQMALAGPLGDYLNLQSRDGIGKVTIAGGKVRSEAINYHYGLHYRQNPATLNLLREALLLLAALDDAWVVWDDSLSRARGRSFVDALANDPSLYWGYDPARMPGAPFERHDHPL